MVKFDNILKCEDLKAFSEVIVEPLKFVGYSQSDFYACEYGGARFLVKMCFYRKSQPEIYIGRTKGTMSQIDAEIKTLNVLRDRVILTGRSPCILEIVYSKVCNKMIEYKANPKDSYTLASIKRIFNYHMDMVKQKLAMPQFAFIVLEKCDMTFGEYLNKSLATPISFAVFKTLLFQIFHALYVIKEDYPKFQHGDMHIENIMLKLDRKYELQPNNMRWNRFAVGDRVYNIPYFGLLPKIIDFGFTRIPEEGIVSNVVKDRTLIYHRVESDALTLMASIYSNVIHQHSHGKITRVSEIFDSLDKERSYAAAYPYIARQAEHPTPLQLLTNPVFDEYLMDVPDDRIIGKYNFTKKSRR